MILQEWWHEKSRIKRSRRHGNLVGWRCRYYPRLEPLEDRFAPALTVMQADIPLTARGLEASGYTAALVSTSNFEDISRGASHAILTGVDDGFVEAPLNFNFTYYGVQYDSVFITSNGLLTFPTLPTDTGYASYGNSDLTTNNGPNRPIIAPLWDDWVVSGTRLSNVFYETLGTPGNERFVVQWNQVSGYPTTPATVTFEVALFQSDNHIEFRYQNVVAGNGSAPNKYDFGENATIGIRSGFPNATAANLYAPGSGALPAGVGGIQIAYKGGVPQQPIVQNGTTIAFMPDLPPTDITLSAATIPENSPVGTPIGTLGAIDPDVGDSFTYSLVNGAADNALFTIVGNQLRSNAVFTNISNNSYNVLVETQELGGLTFQKMFNIKIAGPVIALGQTFTVLPGSPAGTVVGTVLASEPNNLQQLPTNLPPLPTVLTYSMNSKVFAIDPKTGQITVVDPTALLANKALVFSPSVTVTDNATPPLSDTIPVTIDVNFVPLTAAITGAPATSPEGTAINLSSMVNDLTGQTITYRWSVTRNGNPFPTRTPTNGPTFSFTPGNAGIYQVTLAVADSRGATSTAFAATTVTIVPPVVTIGPGSAYTQTGDTITRSVSFTAPSANNWSATVDYGDGTTETFNLTPGNHGYDPATKTFTIQHSYTSAETFTITVTVHDSEGGSGAASVPIAVFDPLEFAHIIAFAIAVADESGTAHVDLALADHSVELAANLTEALQGNTLALTLFNGDPVADGSNASSEPFAIPVVDAAGVAEKAFPVAFTDTRAETIAGATVAESYYFVVPDTLVSANLKFYWFDEAQKIWRPVEGEGAQDNNLVITPLLDGSGHSTGEALLVFQETFASQSSPLVTQLDGTVFTICVPVGNGGAPSPITSLPPTVATNGSLANAAITVETTGFAGRSNVSLSLAGSQIELVQLGLTSRSPLDAPGDDLRPDDQLLNWLINGRLWRRRHADTEPGPQATSTPNGQQAAPANGGGQNDGGGQQVPDRDTQGGAIDEALVLALMGFDGGSDWEAEFGTPAALWLEPSSASEIDGNVLDFLFASTRDGDLLQDSTPIVQVSVQPDDRHVGLALAALMAGTGALPQLLLGGRDPRAAHGDKQPAKKPKRRSRLPRKAHGRIVSVRPPQCYDGLAFSASAPESELMPQAALLMPGKTKFRALMLSLAIAFLSAFSVTPVQAQDLQPETFDSKLVGHVVSQPAASISQIEILPDLRQEANPACRQADGLPAPAISMRLDFARTMVPQAASLQALAPPELLPFPHSADTLLSRRDPA